MPPQKKTVIFWGHLMGESLTALIFLGGVAFFTLPVSLCMRACYSKYLEKDTERENLWASKISGRVVNSWVQTIISLRFATGLFSSRNTSRSRTFFTIKACNFSHASVTGGREREREVVADVFIEKKKNVCKSFSFLFQSRTGNFRKLQFDMALTR